MNLELNKYYLISNDHLKYNGQKENFHVFLNCNNGELKLTDKEVRERVNEINTFNRESFMSFFRDGDKYNELTPDDKCELFLQSLHGSIDITKEFVQELLQKLFNNYGIGNLTVSDSEKELKKIYCVDIDFLPEEHNYKISNEEFAEIAREYGKVYSNINDFVIAFNCELVNTFTDWVVRII